MQLPGQDGKDRPFMNLDEHDYSLANKGAAPQPKPSPTPPPEKQPTPNETANSCAACCHTDASARSARPPHSDSFSGSLPAGIEKRQRRFRMPTETPTPTPEPIRNASTPGLQLPGFPAEDGHPRRDQQPRPLGSECGGHAAGTIQETARGRDRVALVLLYGGEDRLDQHRYDCGDL